MTDAINSFIDNLQFSCLAVAADADADPKQAAVNYLHQVLAELSLDDERREAVDCMAARIAADGLVITYGAYHVTDEKGNNKRTIFRDHKDNVTMLTKGKQPEVKPGADGRWYCISGDHWMWSFPTREAAFTWLSYEYSNTGDEDADEAADDQFFRSLGGEWS